MATERYNAPDRESYWQHVWEKTQIFRASEDQSAPEMLRARDVPLSVGAHPHGPCAQLRDGRRLRPLQARQGLQRAASDGLGRLRHAGRERRDGAQGPPRQVDLRQHRHDARPAEVDGPVARLVARVRHLRRRPITSHQQKLFLDFLKKGLAYRKSSKVNWDPVDHTVLANEQVIDGRGWRSGALVEQRELTQWFFKITDYADELLSDLDTLVNWPEKVRLMQANWIGRSEGMLVRWALDTKHRAEGLQRARGLHDAAGHAVRRVASWRSRRIIRWPRRPPKTTPSSQPSARNAGAWARPWPRSRRAEKRGFDTGITAVHPFDQDWQLPVYVANFILMDYGTGAIFGCPAARPARPRFRPQYGLPVVPVVLPAGRRRRHVRPRRRRPMPTTAR